MTTIKPFNLKWRAISPSFFKWNTVEVFYCGKDLGWRVADNGVFSDDVFFTRNDALHAAEYAYSVQPITL